jgi:hypothetical protein
MLKASYRLHEILSNSRSVLLPGNYRLVLRQICSQFAHFSHCFVGNSGLRKLNLQKPARKNVPILQSRYSFRYHQI